ncbi:hypothetical protein QFC21_007346 [Naganishia friedmannii]|uniref:Uncharacterized protein n=1 Tax=Naganishia friedmannii TaxID=89922 RepID=A0ACC2UV84_9TREE|nr:hypothetical protein QFC21_007346 [Naganishia friedmannii]
MSQLTNYSLCPSEPTLTLTAATPSVSCPSLRATGESGASGGTPYTDAVVSMLPSYHAASVPKDRGMLLTITDPQVLSKHDDASADSAGSLMAGIAIGYCALCVLDRYTGRESPDCPIMCESHVSMYLGWRHGMLTGQPVTDSADCSRELFAGVAACVTCIGLDVAGYEAHSDSMCHLCKMLLPYGGFAFFHRALKSSGPEGNWLMEAVEGKGSESDNR